MWSPIRSGPPPGSHASQAPSKIDHVEVAALDALDPPEPAEANGAAGPEHEADEAVADEVEHGTER